MWILGSRNKDILFFFLPGLLGLLLSFLFKDFIPVAILPIYLFMVFSLIDSGHVYTTLWRTPMKRNYLLVAALIFSLSASLYYWRHDWLWKTVVYLTLFHHLRQNYGMTRWYQRLNKRMCRVSNFFFYALTLIPILFFHFRQNVTHHYYTDDDLILMDSPFVQKILLVIYFFIFSGWIFFELRLMARGISEWNRLTLQAFYFVLYGACFFFGENGVQILIPLLLVHGLTYFAVMSETLKTGSRFKSFYFALFVILVTALVFGCIETYFEEYHIDFKPASPTLIGSIGVGLYLTPLIFHYFLDSIIWKRENLKKPHS